MCRCHLRVVKKALAALLSASMVLSTPWAQAQVRLPWARVDVAGLLWALCSGAVTSGLGYAVWYTALKGLQPTSSASVQLSVPVLTALGGVALLSEPLTLRLALCSAAILGGIACVITGQPGALRRASN